MEKSEELDSPKDIFTENHLVGVCLDLFEAGGETVGSTLSWVLLYLSLQQKEQTNCQREIDSVIGIQTRDRLRFFVQVRHETTYASIENKHFFTK